MKATFRQLAPMDGAKAIRPVAGDLVCRGFYLNTIAEVEKAWLRYVADKQSYSMLNNQKVQAEEMGGYWRADVTDLVKAGGNEWAFCSGWSDG